MKINLFSPVPPSRSAIAEDTANVLPELARRAQVTLWVHEKNWARSLERHAVVRHYDPLHVPWAEVNAADASIYHLGNETTFHGPIWEVSRRCPGLIVLHDLSLQHLFAGMVSASRLLRPSDYLQMMDFYHLDGGRKLGADLLAGKRSIDEVEIACPLIGAALENATAVAVHTQNAYEQLSAVLDVPVAYLPLSAPALVTSERDPASRSAPAICGVIIFGFLAANRRLSSFITALQQLPERERFHLDVYGKVADERAFLEEVEALGLSRTVTLHGFVSDEELNAALARSDLAINLRDPTMGEASASQLRIWQHGLPSLVTDIGWYATLPEGTVARVRREHEIEDIQMHLTQFLADPARYQEIGRCGYHHVREHHTVEAYVDGLLKLIEEERAAKSREAVRWMSSRVGWSMKPWFTEETASVSLPRVAKAIGELFDELPRPR